MFVRFKSLKKKVIKKIIYPWFVGNLDETLLQLDEYCCCWGVNIVVAVAELKTLFTLQDEFVWPAIKKPLCVGEFPEPVIIVVVGVPQTPIAGDVKIVGDTIPVAATAVATTDTAGTAGIDDGS